MREDWRLFLQKSLLFLIHEQRQKRLCHCRHSRHALESPDAGEVSSSISRDFDPHRRNPARSAEAVRGAKLWRQRGEDLDGRVSAYAQAMRRALDVNSDDMYKK